MSKDKEEKEKGSSPVPQNDPQTKVIPGEIMEDQALMSFGDVLKALVAVENSRARRIGWLEKGAPEDFITIKGGQLHVFTKGTMHTLIVNDGDIAAEDWVTI
jgi:hypothetical protein